MSGTWFRPKQKNDKTVTIKMTNDQFVTLNVASARLMMTRSDLIKNSINEYLAKHSMI